MARIYPKSVIIGNLTETDLFVNVAAASAHIGFYGDESSQGILVDMLAAAETLVDEYLGYTIGTRHVQEIFKPSVPGSPVFVAGDYIIPSQPRPLVDIGLDHGTVDTDILWDPDLVLDHRLTTNDNNRRLKFLSLIHI